MEMVDCPQGWVDQGQPHFFPLFRNLFDPYIEGILFDTLLFREHPLRDRPFLFEEFISPFESNLDIESCLFTVEPFSTFLDYRFQVRAHDSENLLKFLQTLDATRVHRQDSIIRGVISLPIHVDPPLCISYKFNGIKK